jgi:hypothetical protein
VVLTGSTIDAVGAGVAVVAVAVLTGSTMGAVIAGFDDCEE